MSPRRPCWESHRSCVLRPIRHLPHSTFASAATALLQPAPSPCTVCPFVLPPRLSTLLPPTPSQTQWHRLPDSRLAPHRSSHHLLLPAGRRPCANALRRTLFWLPPLLLVVSYRERHLRVRAPPHTTQRAPLALRRRSLSNSNRRPRRERVATYAFAPAARRCAKHARPYMALRVSLPPLSAAHVIIGPGAINHTAPTHHGASARTPLSRLSPLAPSPSPSRAPVRPPSRTPFADHRSRIATAFVGAVVSLEPSARPAFLHTPTAAHRVTCPTPLPLAATFPPPFGRSPLHRPLRFVRTYVVTQTHRQSLCCGRPPRPNYRRPRATCECERARPSLRCRPSTIDHRPSTRHRPSRISQLLSRGRPRAHLVSSRPAPPRHPRLLLSATPPRLASFLLPSLGPSPPSFPPIPAPLSPRFRRAAHHAPRTSPRRPRAHVGAQREPQVRLAALAGGRPAHGPAPPREDRQLLLAPDVPGTRPLPCPVPCAIATLFPLAPPPFLFAFAFPLLLLLRFAPAARSLTVNSIPSPFSARATPPPPPAGRLRAPV